MGLSSKLRARAASESQANPPIIHPQIHRQESLDNRSSVSSSYASLNGHTARDNYSTVSSNYRSLNVDLAYQTSHISSRMSALSVSSEGSQNLSPYSRESTISATKSYSKHYRTMKVPATKPTFDHLKMREHLQRIVKVNGLEKFCPDSSVNTILERMSTVDFEALSSTWGIPREIVEELAALALYDIVLLADDSGSMLFEDNGARIQELKKIISRIAQVATLFDEDGILVRFFNSTIEGLGITTQDQVNDLVNQVKFRGLSPIGRVLEEKVIEPLVYTAMQEESLKKPVLIYIITDGEPSGEDPLKIFHTIYKCRHNTFRHGYGKAVAFEFAQIGKDVGAQKFLSQLDMDKQFGDVVDTTSYYELEAEEFAKKGIELTPDLWLLKLMLGAIDPSYDEQDEAEE